MFKITRFLVSYEVHNPLIFSTYPGFYIRNAIIKALAQSCVEPTRVKEQKIISCNDCKHHKTCTYFALKLPVKEQVSRPVPMSFSLNTDSLVTGKYESGSFSFTITLFGSANYYIQAFEKAFGAIGEVFGLGDNGTSRNVSFLSIRKIKPEPLFDSLHVNKHGSAFLVKFKHLRLAENIMNPGFQLSFPQFAGLIRTRLLELDDVYGNNVLKNTPLYDIINLKPVVLRSKSEYAKCNYKYAGTDFGYYFLSGKTLFTGNYEPWMQLIAVGQQIGLGRFTSYGFGHYEVVFQ